MSRPPVIIIGMHRSGTSLLTGLLRHCGWFMGARRNVHDEALYFFRQNERLFRLAHAAWDQPRGMAYLWQDEAMRAALLQELRRNLGGRAALPFLGWWLFLRCRHLSCLERPWGWKEPRTCYTLPLWLELFPQARVIHISRHGVDVAASLQQREAERPAGWRDPLYSARCRQLSGGFSLWVEYEEQCRQVTVEMPAEQWLHLRYEDLLENPRLALAEVGSFLDHTFDPILIKPALERIRPDRAYAFRQDEALLRFYQEQREHPLLQLYGYDQV